MKVTACPTFDGFLNGRGLVHHLLHHFRRAAHEVRVAAVYRFDIARAHWQRRGREASRAASNVPVPSKVVPFLNVTVSPSGGAPDIEVTVAVKVTGCP